MKKLYLITLFIWFLSLLIWQILFKSNETIQPILWEIHTIYSSSIAFFILLNCINSEKILDIIKIIFRILFKVWFVILVAFTLKRSFDLKGFLLTTTFVFGYLEGQIDLYTWINNGSGIFIVNDLKLDNIKRNKVLISVSLIGIIHALSALIAFIFFKIK